MDVGKSIMRASDIGDAWGLNMVVFGNPGAGKTTYCATAQDSDKGRDTLFIDVEGGTRSISDREDIAVLKPETFEELKEIYDWLSKGDHKYRTIVLDSLTEIQRLSLKSVMKVSATPEQPSQPEYGKSNENIAVLMRNFKLFSQERGWNVIATALAVEVKDDSTGAILTRVDLTPGAAKNVFQVADTIGYLGIETTRQGNTRYLLLHQTSSILAKHRQPRSGTQLPTRIEEPTLPMILDHKRGG